MKNLLSKSDRFLFKLWQIIVLSPLIEIVDTMAFFRSFTYIIYDDHPKFGSITHLLSTTAGSNESAVELFPG